MLSVRRPNACSDGPNMRSNFQTHVHRHRTMRWSQKRAAPGLNMRWVGSPNACSHARTCVFSHGTHVRTYPTCFKCANACSNHPNMRSENTEACSSHLNMRSTGKKQKSMFAFCEPARVCCKRMLDAPNMRAYFLNACSDVSNMRSTRKTHVRGV